jgi:hypothetical protein
MCGHSAADGSLARRQNIIEFSVEDMPRRKREARPYHDGGAMNLQ